MVHNLICHLDSKNYSKIRDLADIFSEYSLNHHKLKIEIAFLISLSSAGITRPFSVKEQKFLAEIGEKFSQKEFLKLQQIDREVNHDIKAIEIYLRDKMANTSLKDVANYVHFCLSSEDINNLAYGLALLEGKKLLIIRINEIIKELRALAEKSAEYPMMSLTHGQPASPTTFGKEVAVFIGRLERELSHLSELVLEGKLNGSVGNMSSFTAINPEFDWLNFSDSFVSELGLKPNSLTTQILPYDSWARHFDSIKRINNIFLDLVTDFWWYASFSYLKLKVISKEVGSSSMPHKVNPIDLEAAEGNLGYSNSQLVFLTDKLTKSRMQRDLSDSTVRRNVGLVLAYSYFAYDSILRALSRLEADSLAMADVLERNWQILMEPMQNILRDEGVKGDYELVKQLSRGKKLNRSEYYSLISKTKLPQRVKKRLRDLSPMTYLGLAPQLAVSKVEDRHTVVVGSQWGDEGKGKMVDYLAREFNVCVRFSGGNNAGHTVVVDGESFKLSLLPSGVLYGKTLCIAQGAVVDPGVLVDEIKYFEKKFKKPLKLLIDPRVHLVMPYHKDWDAATEHWRGKDKVGSLHLGIGYTYSDRTNRFGIRFEDLIEPGRLKAAIANNYQIKKDIITKVYGWNMSTEIEEIYRLYVKYSKFLKPYVGDVSELVSSQFARHRKVLFEGAQGTFLDLGFGTYPYAVGCHTLSGSLFEAVGLSPEKLNVVGLVKAYTTRVGGGPFKSELDNRNGEKIRDRGGEYGTVSKRPRRVGWLELPMIRYAHRLNGFSSVALTKLDVLSGIEKLKVCTHYRLNSQKLDQFPALQKDYARVKPVYKVLDGWPEDISSINNYEKLPSNCKKYVEFIEDNLQVKIKYISVGPERDAVILR